MLRCRTFVGACLAVGLVRADAAPAPADVPSWAGFAAVPQIWSPASSMQIAPDRLFLVVVEDYQVDVVALTTGTILRRLETGRQQFITGTGISADSKSIVAVVEDGRQLAWDVETGRALPSVPVGVNLQWKWKANGPAPYKFNVSNQIDDQPARIEISSGTKSLATLHADVIRTDCESGVVSPIFDGRYLVYGLSDGVHFNETAVVSELRGGTFHELWRSPCDDKDGGPQVLGDGRFLSLTEAPVGPLTLWDLTVNRIAAVFTDADGIVATSTDGRTIVASAYTDSNLEVPVFKVVRDGRTRSFPRQMKEIKHLVLSPGGRWLAAQDQSSLIVWSMDDGHVQRKVETEPGAEAPQIRGITDDGRLTLTSDRHPAFHDEAFFDESTDGRWAYVQPDIFDIKQDRRIAHLVGEWVDHFDGNLAFIRGGPWRVLDLTTARPVWTLHVPPDGYVLAFPDGCVQVAPGSERYVKLVRGFEVRPYDAAAAKVFARPGCNGRPQMVVAPSP